MRFQRVDAVGANDASSLEDGAKSARGVVVGIFGFLALVGAAGLALIAAGSLGGNGVAPAAAADEHLSLH